MMKIITVILQLISVFIVQQAWAQTPEIERLIKTEEHASGKEKIIALADLCKNFYSVDPQKGIEYGKEALRLADSLKIPSAKSKVYNSIGVNYWAMADLKTARIYYDKALRNAVIFKDSFEIAIFYNRMGLIYESQGNFDSCLIVFNKELDLNKRLKNDERTGTSLENIGTIHLNRGEFKSAITYLLEATTIFEKLNNSKKLAFLYLKLGQIYSETKEFSIAEKWFQKGIDLSLEFKDYQKVGIGLNAIGVLYKNQQRYDEALVKFSEALKNFEKLKNAPQDIAINGNIGNVYVMQGKYYNAIPYHRKSLELALKLSNPLAVAGARYNLGDDYYGLKDYAKARSYYTEAMAAYSKSKSRSNLIKTYNALIQANNSLKDYSQSVKYYQLYIDAEDSLTRTELNSALDSLKIKFNTEQTEHENILLVQKTELQSKTISLQRTILFSSFIFLVLLISLAIVIIRSRHKIKKANELLAIKNLDISSKAEELRIVNDKLLELSKFKDSMNSFLVHDLKNSLNTIINIDLRHLSEHQIEIIKQSGKQMLNLVMNILDISRYENHSIKISTQEASLTQIINTAYSEVEYFSEQKSIHLMINYTNDFIVKVDPEIVGRVFVNLFSNAIRYTPAGGNIHIFAECLNQTRLKVMVKDNGEGIDADFQSIIFDKFTQTDKKQSGSAGSTGIGLTFCKMAVEAHSGEIGVDSIAGEGASFWFTLPLAESENDLLQNQGAVIESSARPARVQLSDEEKHLLFPYCDLLKKLNIYQISDVKDVLNSIDIKESANIIAWKSLILKSLSNCNKSKYDELLNFNSDGKL